MREAMKERKSVLMVVTSHGRIDDQHPTGLWFEEFAVPFKMFREHGFRVTVASPKGGAVPIDPRSEPKDKNIPDTKAALDTLKNTKELRSVNPAAFDAMFVPGGHGTMYDLANNPTLTKYIGYFAERDKVIGSVCHGPASFIGATRADGAPLVMNRRVTAFTNAEERAVELDERMPFLLESRLRELGAKVEIADNWADHVVVDGHLVTGQNPQSSGHAAQAVINLLSQ